MLALSGLAGCGSRGVAPEPTPPPVAGDARPRETLSLPDVPPQRGELNVSIIYPPAGSMIAARDSNFIFGSLGTGEARLRINGTSVDVAPNGAFLAFLPVPDQGEYVIEATDGDRRVNVRHAVRTPAPLSVPGSGADILTGSLYPRGVMALPAGEAVEVGFQGSAGGQATLVLPDGRRIALVEQPLYTGPSVDALNFRTDAAMGEITPSRVSWYRGSFGARTLHPSDSAVARPVLAGPLLPGDTGHARVVLVTGADTARAALPLRLAALDRLALRVGLARPPAEAPHDWTLRGRPSTAGPFHWFFAPGARLTLTGERGGFLRVALGPDLSAWVAKEDVHVLAPGAPPPAAEIAGVRFIAASSHIDLRIPLGTRLPHHVETSERGLQVTIYGASSQTNFFQYGSLDPLLERAMWSQPADGVYRVTVELTVPVWGYHSFYDAADALVVRIRRPPSIDVDQPLRGLLVAVDAGHPPAGSTGPTGLTEAEANLAIALRLQPLLEQAGARVLMTRTDAGPVELGLRPRIATDSDAHVLLSIHNNAFPDGVNPFENAGTSVYFYQPFSLDLARLVQRELLDELGTRDIGIGRADLALVRPTWMPSILSETLYMMLPRHEAALRDPAVHERIARAHVRALETFLRERAAAQR
jgi:N-acetylmuramoyl-L-alanine amidase